MEERQKRAAACMQEMGVSPMEARQTHTHTHTHTHSCRLFQFTYIVAIVYPVIGLFYFRLLTGNVAVLCASNLGPPSTKLRMGRCTVCWAGATKYGAHMPIPFQSSVHLRMKKRRRQGQPGDELTRTSVSKSSRSNSSNSSA